MVKFKSAKRTLIARTFLLAKEHIEFLKTIDSNKRSEFLRFLIDNSDEYQQFKQEHEIGNNI